MRNVLIFGFVVLGLTNTTAGVVVAIIIALCSLGVAIYTLGRVEGTARDLRSAIEDQSIGIQAVTDKAKTLSET